MRSLMKTLVVLLLCGWPLLGTLGLVVYIELTHDDPYGGAPWLLVFGAVGCLPTSLMTGLAHLATYARPRGETPQYAFGGAVYVAGCCMAALVAHALLQRV